MSLIKKLLIVLIPVLFISCVSNQDININSSGEGSCAVRIELSDFVIEYIKDISDISGDESLISIFDEKAIKDSFEKYSDVTLVDLKVFDKNILEIRFSFDNPDQFLKDSDSNPVLSYGEKGENSYLYFNLDADNYPFVSQMFALDETPGLSGFTPQPENPYPDDEYLEMVDFIFSDYADGADIVSIFKNSVVRISVNTDGKVLKAENGKIKGNTVEFEIPLIRFLTLSEPVSFYMEYK